MNEHSPLLPLVHLWATTSRGGMPYMSGSLGMVKLILLPARGTQSDGHTHELCIIPPNDGAQQAAAKGAPSTEGQLQTDASLRPLPEHVEKKLSIDDEIPF